VQKETDDGKPERDYNERERRGKKKSCNGQLPEMRHQNVSDFRESIEKTEYK